MKDEEIAKQAIENGPLKPPKTKVKGEGIIDELVGLFPAEYHKVVINVGLGLIGLVWIVDMITPDPIPFIDEAGLAYLFYLLWAYKKNSSKS